MYKAFLIKYAEIGLKGKNRHVFENILRDQVQYHLDKLGNFEVSREQGRIFVSCPEEYDYDETIEELQKVFGVAGICPVVVVESTDWEVITEEALKYYELADEKGHKDALGYILELGDLFKKQKKYSYQLLYELNNLHQQKEHHRGHTY